MLSALLQDGLMTAMHPIEITDGGNAATMSRSQVVQTSNDAHGTSAVGGHKASDYNEPTPQDAVL
ncbi:conserved hypothetical protein [Halomonas sp. 59]|nr:conserved hypothetical protein [Halomonas sp. 59]CAD5257176.1 conserved hypothetical protein [Halomonas sp. 113]CAD5270990.1 conserved hypothetical protein [Halomonas sp. I3]CAD5291705.1 conserved hypothetical protein [Halomonas sp. 156]VXB23055.1 conserved hypothetical protein [Halomonas titanicae]